MEKINLRGVLEVLSEKELKNVVGGIESCGEPGKQYCKDKVAGDKCNANGKSGVCKGWPAIPPCLICCIGCEGSSNVFPYIPPIDEPMSFDEIVIGETVI